MELTDDQWREAREVAVAKALKLTRGDVPLSEDLASIAMEKMFLKEGSIGPDKLKAYVQTVVQNTYFDRLDRQKAAFRPQVIHKEGLDDAVIAEVKGVFKYQLNSTSPSRRLIRHEMQNARARACLEILESLPAKHKDLVRMAADG